MTTIKVLSIRNVKILDYKDVGLPVDWPRVRLPFLKHLQKVTFESASFVNDDMMHTIVHQAGSI